MFVVWSHRITFTILQVMGHDLCREENGTQIAVALKLVRLKQHFSGLRVWDSQHKSSLKKSLLMIMEKLYDRISYGFLFIGFIIWYFQHLGKKGSGFSDTSVRNSNIILLILKKKTNPKQLVSLKSPAVLLNHRPRCQTAY